MQVNLSLIIIPKKNIAQNVWRFIKNAYLCNVISYEFTTSRRAIKL